MTCMRSLISLQIYLTVLFTWDDLDFSIFRSFQIPKRKFFLSSFLEGVFFLITSFVGAESERTAAVLNIHYISLFFLNPSIFNIMSLSLTVLDGTPIQRLLQRIKLFFCWVPLEENDCLVWCWGGIELDICFLSRYSTILLFFKSHLHFHCQRYLQPKPFRYVQCTWSCFCPFPAASSVVSSQSAFQPLHFVAVVSSPRLCKNPCTGILMYYLKKMKLNVFVDSSV